MRSGQPSIASSTEAPYHIHDRTACFLLWCSVRGLVFTMGGSSRKNPLGKYHHPEQEQSQPKETWHQSACSCIHSLRTLVQCACCHRQEAAPPFLSGMPFISREVKHWIMCSFLLCILDITGLQPSVWGCRRHHLMLSSNENMILEYYLPLWRCSTIRSCRYFNFFACSEDSFKML